MNEKDRKMLSNDTYWICPLYSFECDTNSNDIDLGEEASIWRIPDTLRNKIDLFDRELKLDQEEVEWVIRFKKIQGSPHASEAMLEELSRIAINIATSLRLQHEGDVVPGPIIYSLDGDNNCVSEGVIYAFDYSSEATKYFSLDLNTYVLSKAEIQIFIDFWKNYNTRQNNSKLNDIAIAVRRFNSAYTESLEDKLIDHMIALESLYIGDNMELGYKLALRASFLLAENESDRGDIRKRLNDAYTVRSNIVHGKEISRNIIKNRADLENLVTDTEEYLRQTLRRFIQLSDKYPSLKQLRKNSLDQNIIENGQLLKG